MFEKITNKFLKETKETAMTAVAEIKEEVKKKTIDFGPWIKFGGLMFVMYVSIKHGTSSSALMAAPTPVVINNYYQLPMGTATTATVSTLPKVVK